MNTTFATPRASRPLAALALAALMAAGVAATSGAAVAAAPASAPPPAASQSGPPAAASPKAGLNLNMGMNQVDKMLDKVQATPDQRTKIKAILMDAFMSMASIAPQVKATASDFGKALMSPHVNRAELETARLSAVSDFDAFTKVMAKALGDAAETLTPEQRAKLAKSKTQS